MLVTWVKACLWDILKFCLLIVTCLEVYSTEFWGLFAAIACTFLIVVVQERFFHLIYVKVLILISCCVFQALCKMCLFSQTQRFPNYNTSTEARGEQGWMSCWCSSPYEGRAGLPGGRMSLADGIRLCEVYCLDTGYPETSGRLRLMKCLGPCSSDVTWNISSIYMREDMK